MGRSLIRTELISPRNKGIPKYGKFIISLMKWEGWSIHFIFTGLNIKSFPEMEKNHRKMSRAGKILFRSEEHTSELQSRFELVCRLLLEKKNKEVKQMRARGAVR